MTQETYDTIGEGYAGRRQPDPRMAAAIFAALADAGGAVYVNCGASRGKDRPRHIRCRRVGLLADPRLFARADGAR
jgi:hypothetical protein